MSLSESTIDRMSGSTAWITVERNPLYDSDMTAAADTTTDETGAWEGILVVEGIETGDQRKFSAGSITWPDPKTTVVPLMWAKQNNGEHKGSVVVGRINEMWRDPAAPAMVRGRGVFDLGDADGAEAYRKVDEGFMAGISIDPDQIADAQVELQYAPSFDDKSEDEIKLARAMGQEKPTLTVFHGGRIRGATLVAFPAFVESQIALSNASESVVAASYRDEVVFTQWDVTANSLSLEDEIPYHIANDSFAYVKPTGKKVKKYNCHLLHHEFDSTLGIAGPANMDAVESAMKIINGRTPTGLAPHEQYAAYEHLAAHYVAAELDPPAYRFASEVNDLVACGGDNAPPKEWFHDPKLDGPTPLTVDDKGRVFGHAALWSSCHTSFGDACVQPPYETDYAYFTTGEVVTADGSRVAAGQITLGTSHAATRGVSAQMAVDHYGNTGTSVADVAAGSDAFGIWFNGAVRPGTDPDRIRALRASALSGDWRRIGGNLRMVALLAVNVPGFPVPRTSTFVSGTKQLSLVAAGIPVGTTLHDAQIQALRDRVFGKKSVLTAAVEQLKSKIYKES